MKKEIIIQNGMIAAKGIVAIIPFLGGTITSIWSDMEAFQAKRKHERLEEFYVTLREDVERIKEQLNVSFIKKPDFLDIFELTAKYIVNERNEEKRFLFKNILLNSITSQECTYDKTEKYLRILEQMSNLEILLLRVLQNPTRYNEDRGNEIKNPNEVHSNVHYTLVAEFKEILHSLVKAPIDDIAEAMYFLETNRLVKEKASGSKLQTNGNPIHVLDDKLTMKGKSFISFIIQV